MDLLSIIITFIGAYGLFMFLAYVLARIFFPIIDMKEKPRRVRARHAKKVMSRALR
jgi:hypothetical protein